MWTKCDRSLSRALNSREVSLEAATLQEKRNSLPAEVRGGENDRGSSPLPRPGGTPHRVIQ